MQGRFTSVDPLLSSGTVYSPQTWNRYSYSLNNPLRYTDSLGLFTWDDSAGGSATDADLEARKKNKQLSKDERNQAKLFLERRERFRNAMTRAQQAANNNSISANERADISSTLAAYGAENANNGVTVGGGTLANNSGGAQITPSFNFATGWVTGVSVIIDDRASGDNAALNVIHEGQHTADALAFGSALSRLGDAALSDRSNRTRYNKEFRGYYIECIAAQALGLGN